MMNKPELNAEKSYKSIHHRNEPSRINGRKFYIKSMINDNIQGEIKDLNGDETRDENRVGQIKRVEKVEPCETSINKKFNSISTMTEETMFNLPQIKCIDFKHISIHREKDDNHVVVLTNIGEIKKVNIYNWELNRPIDKTRIPDIIKNNKHKTMLEGTIYLVKKTKTGRYYCYDGMHRLSSFEGLNQKCKIIVDIMIDPTNGTIVDRFTVINQSISVPELYTNNMFEKDIKQTVLNVVDYYIKNYPTHFSPKKNYNVPNCNREIMINMITEMIKQDENRKSFNQEEWLMELKNREIRIKVLVTTTNKYKITNKQLEKCSSTGFYLFAIKQWNIEYL